MSIHIIGAGRVGITLGRLWHQSGKYPIGQIMNRRIETARNAVAFVGAGQTRETWFPVGPGDLVFIGVRDDDIAVIDEQLASFAVSLDGVTIFHASGVHGASVLKHCHEAGAGTGVLHPLASFADPETLVNVFEGTPCAITCPPNDTRGTRQCLHQLARDIGGDPIDVDEQGKAIYHAGAVSSSNFIVAVMSVAGRWLEASGIDAKRANALACQLAQQTLTTIESLGPEKALTGPVARGDVETISRHLDAPELGDSSEGVLYRALVRYLAEEVATGRVDQKKLDAIKDLVRR